ncbi:MAG: hypothetical protein IPP07_15785 [Holophagales bacterium]|nr:hypothetical protein [Holophagales bacterium]
MKSVSEDVLRSVALRREWMKKYSLMAAIVMNPRSPIDVTLPLILRLAQRDQTALCHGPEHPRGRSGDGEANRAASSALGWPLLPRRVARAA